MKIAIASGKGGTGKTTVALALAEVSGALLADCDVEEPNCHLFMAAEAEKTIPVTVLLPEFSGAACPQECRKCVQSCRFNALAKLGKKVLVFPELCHGCGGCVRQCPEQFLRETAHEIGKIRTFPPACINLMEGVMQVGYSMAPPVIRAVKEFVRAEKEVIFDAPPGTACAMVTAVRDCDHVLLVTEPTPLGLHDLRLAYRTIAELGIPCSVILNRAGENDALIENFCAENALPLRLKIPFSREIAHAYSSGRTLLAALPQLKTDFLKLWQDIGGEK